MHGIDSINLMMMINRKIVVVVVFVCNEKLEFILKMEFRNEMLCTHLYIIQV